MLKKKIILLILLLMPIITSMTMIHPSAEETNSTVSMEDIAKYYAPIWYQDIDDSDADADYITNFDFDKNWIGYDNWQNQDNESFHPLKPYIYYSVVETIDHWYIGYYDFHPRDWDERGISALQHENDLEGCLAIILKNGATYGEAQALITQAHCDFFQYRYPTESGNKLTDNQATIEETCHVTENGANGYRAHLFVQCKGHGVYAAPVIAQPWHFIGNWWDNTGFPGVDGVIYDYYSHNESSSPIDQPGTQTANYSLVDISALYDRVDNGEMYYHDDYNYYDDPLKGVTHENNKAFPPWAWAEDDGSKQGWIFWEPWKTAETFFNGETFSNQTIQTNYNGIKTITITVEEEETPWLWIGVVSLIAILVLIIFIQRIYCK